MTDTIDNVVLHNSIVDPVFQDRCRLRFINSAISVTTEVASLVTNALTAAASPVLHFASTTGIVAGMAAADLTTPAAIPASATVLSVTSTTVTISANVVSPGVASGDTITFTPPNHAARLALAGAIFQGTIEPKVLAMAILANATNRTNCLAAPNSAGGNILDSDMDFQANSVFTGIALSRAW